VLAPTGESGDQLAAELAEKMRGTAPAAMLNATILKSYSKIVRTRVGDPRVRTLVAPGNTEHAATAALFETDASTFLAHPDLAEEMFGPATLLTAPGDEEAAAQLVSALETRVGRIVFNGYPTGVEVCQAMVHGGPYPATPDGRTTSVGGRAIERFVRAVCWQDASAELLPEELRDGNPAGLLRIVNGERTREPFAAR